MQKPPVGDFVFRPKLIEKRMYLVGASYEDTKGVFCMLFMVHGLHLNQALANTPSISCATRGASLLP
jgi:hypothetical protein